MKPLLVCSKSTRDFFPHQFERVRIVDGPPQKDILDEMGSEEEVVACGGGAVIDTAKILSKNPITCYPTTASGSSATSWGVYWDGPNKHSCYRQKPNQVLFEESLMEGLPNDILINTTCDAISHCFDSLNSTKATDESMQYALQALMLLREKEDKVKLLKAGHLAGCAIEITGTNLLHCLSYPMTGHYGISHGRALAWLLPKFAGFMGHGDNILDGLNVELENDINLDLIVDEALKYDKIHESSITVDHIILKGLLDEKYTFTS